MRRLYDNEGNIAAGVARQLRYERPHGRVAPHHDQAQIGPITALFGFVAAGFILLVLVVGFFALLGYLADRHFMAQTQAQQKNVQTEENSDLPRQVIETRTRKLRS